MTMQITISGAELRTLIENAIVKEIGTAMVPLVTILINVDGGAQSYEVSGVNVTITVPEKKV